MSEEKHYEEKVHVTVDDLNDIKEIVVLNRKLHGALNDIKEIVVLNRKLHGASMTLMQGMSMAILEDAVDLALERFGGGK